MLTQALVNSLFLLGYFTSLEDACAARASVLAQLEHYHANHGN